MKSLRRIPFVILLLATSAGSAIAQQRVKLGNNAAAAVLVRICANAGFGHHRGAGQDAQSDPGGHGSV